MWFLHPFPSIVRLYWPRKNSHLWPAFFLGHPAGHGGGWCPDIYCYREWWFNSLAIEHGSWKQLILHSSYMVIFQFAKCFSENQRVYIQQFTSDNPVTNVANRRSLSHGPTFDHVVPRKKHRCKAPHVGHIHSGVPQFGRQTHISTAADCYIPTPTIFPWNAWFQTSIIPSIDGKNPDFLPIKGASKMPAALSRSACKNQARREPNPPFAGHSWENHPKIRIFPAIFDLIGGGWRAMHPYPMMLQHIRNKKFISNSQ